MASEYKELMANLDETGEYSDDVLASFKEALKNSNQHKLGSMANTKEIRKQISSISNTQKITSAMEMVASSKMRKTQDRMEMGRPYADRMLSVIGHLANSNPEYKPLYMTERETKNIGIIVVSSDKGLCGGLNINLFRSWSAF